jgi:hypothetical protein
MEARSKLGVLKRVMYIGATHAILGISLSADMNSVGPSILTSHLAMHLRLRRQQCLSPLFGLAH